VNLKKIRISRDWICDGVSGLKVAISTEHIDEKLEVLLERIMLANDFRTVVPYMICTPLNEGESKLMLLDSNKDPDMLDLTKVVWVIKKDLGVVCPDSIYEDYVFLFSNKINVLLVKDAKTEDVIGFVKAYQGKDQVFTLWSTLEAEDHVAF
jgi:hypothetical protein